MKNKTIKLPYPKNKKDKDINACWIAYAQLKKLNYKFV